MLEAEGLKVYYEELQALIDVSIKVHEGELLVVIGSNGAGKTTFLKTVSGLIRPRAGTILWRGEPIEELPTDDVCKLGIIHVPEGRKLFPQMTVLENLEMGAYLPVAKNQAKETFQEVFEIFPILKERRKQPAGTLSGGQQQMLAIGRALMAKPKLLMLDEPSLGLSPKVASEIYNILSRLNEAGMSILLVSQDVLQALEIADRAYVIENGSIVLEGTGPELLRNSGVKEAYLGI
jgi:branched-chain amino acid transport system ATP-binding protein